MLCWNRKNTDELLVLYRQIYAQVATTMKICDLIKILLSHIFNYIYIFGEIDSTEGSFF